MTFGRKGIGPGQVAPSANRSAAVIDPQAAEIAARREAFLAAERARRAESAADDDPLGHLRNDARPATRRTEPVGESWNPVSEDVLRTARSGGGGAGESRQTFMWGAPESRNLAIAYLLWFVIGQTSMHRFYCGQKESAWIQVGLFVGSVVILFIFPPLGMLGLAVWVIWLLADLFLIPGMLRRFKAEHQAHYGRIFA